MKLRDQFESPSVQQALSVIAILLLLALGPVQALHSHSGATAQADDVHCAVCQAAHVTASLILTITIFALVFKHASRVLFEPLLRSSDFHSSLFSRPPPLFA
jgi:hypothetical protein